MKIIIHRGTHQIGGVAAEIATEKTRILIDMGDELSLDPDFVSAPLQIPGVTDANGHCDAVLFTHYHGDHVGQMGRIRDGIPLYAGTLAKDIMRISAEARKQKDGVLCDKLEKLQTFTGGKILEIGDLRITPWSVDHSACDSYLFLIEGDGKRILYTGDFRVHGFRGKTLPKILGRIGKVDAVITEGTTLSRPDEKPMTETELQQKVREYMARYPYVFVLCASTNLDRICAISKAVPRGKYFVCDDYQDHLLKAVEAHWGHLSPLYRNIKRNTYGDNLLPGLRERGFAMVVRDNRKFREIISKFDPVQSIILYSMWDGYRTAPNSTLPQFLGLAGSWEKLHTGGHASRGDILKLIGMADPEVVIPIHTDNPGALQASCQNAKVMLAADNEEIFL